LQTADTPARNSSTTLRVVLDTNVLISLFVFTDSRYTPLRTAMEDGGLAALTDERCLNEFRRVLAYPMFSLDAATQQAALAAYAALAQTPTARPEPATPLPLCKDPDDQKFLELARDGLVAWLVTSDKALLKLARRQRLRDLFCILTPDAALAALPTKVHSTMV
jgi:putative PIN family toxin of toxin-antitoxin system